MYRLETLSTVDDGFHILDYLPVVEFTNFGEASKFLRDALRSNNIKTKGIAYCAPGCGYTCYKDGESLGAVFIAKVGCEDELLIDAP